MTEDTDRTDIGRKVVWHLSKIHDLMDEMIAKYGASKSTETIGALYTELMAAAIAWGERNPVAQDMGPALFGPADPMTAPRVRVDMSGDRATMVQKVIEALPVAMANESVIEVVDTERPDEKPLIYAIVSRIIFFGEAE